MVLKRTDWIVILNIPISMISMVILFFFDWPLEVIGAIGVSWVVTSSFSVFLSLRKKGGEAD